MLDARIAQGDVSLTEVDILAETLARFYSSAAHAEFTGSSYRTRVASDIEAKAASLALPRYGLEPTAIERPLLGLRAWLAQYGPLLEARAPHVVDAHGDLRPEHICLERPPVVIDCLDFDRHLRLLDPLAELSFLAVECRRLGADWIGARLLSRVGPTENEQHRLLVGFYQSHHAVVRATVALWHLDDPGLAGADAWRERARVYLATAERVLDASGIFRSR
jgi:aminoglycoside phosphotransferase family enzyme